jgi:hypothetical protein
LCHLDCGVFQGRREGLNLLVVTIVRDADDVNISGWSVNEAKQEEATPADDKQAEWALRSRKTAPSVLSASSRASR